MNQRKALEACPTRQRIHVDENKREDTRRDIELGLGNIDALRLHGDITAAQLFSNFVQDKKQLGSMKERFSLLVDNPEYSGIVRYVDLGTTTSAESIHEIDLLKGQYHELYAHLKDTGAVKKEIPRKKSRRDFEVRQTPSTNEYLVIARNRQLLLGRVAMSNGIDLDFEVAKRMVFELPTRMYLAIVKDDLKVENEKTKRLLERQIDINHQLIYPIRTEYGATTQRVF